MLGNSNKKSLNPLSRLNSMDFIRKSSKSSNEMISSFFSLVRNSSDIMKSIFHQFKFEVQHLEVYY
jgi:hypothetical protein